MTLRVAFDVGGVLSKYPEQFRALAKRLVATGCEVFVISDMPRPVILETLALNGFDFIDPLNVRSADYAAHGEGCKAVLLKQLSIDMFFDDFLGYLAEVGCPIRCLVMPDATKPYYADDWKQVGDESSFGRRVYSRSR